MQTSNAGHICPAGAGTSYGALGTTMTILARHEDTGGVVETYVISFPTATGLPPHFHQHADESIYVIDGAITLQIGDRVVEATSGSYAFVPRGTVHALQNVSAATCNVLVSTPKLGIGVESMLQEVNALPPGPPDLAVVVPILERADIYIVPPG